MHALRIFVRVLKARQPENGYVLDHLEPVQGEEIINHIDAWYTVMRAKYSMSAAPAVEVARIYLIKLEDRIS